MNTTHQATGKLSKGTATATCTCGWSRTETGVGTGHAAFMAQQHEQAMAAAPAHWCRFPDCIHHPKPVALSIVPEVALRPLAEIEADAERVGLMRTTRAQRAAATRRARKAEALGITLAGA